MGDDIVLNDQQQKALDLVANGKNVFITGSAGTGKSLIISKLREWAADNEKEMWVTALTGVAAANVGGATLHSWGGIGLGKSEPRKHAYYVRKKEKTLSKYIGTDILVIDEVSMSDYNYINTLDSVAKIVRNNLAQPFGGIQIVMCGDFYQLGPVQKKDQVKFLFEDFSWNRIIDVSVHLTKVYRQTQSDFIDILHKIRVGDVDDNVVKAINDTKTHKLKNDLGILPTILYCRNKDVDIINKTNIDSLEGEVVKFKHYDYFENDDAKQLFEKSFTLPVDLELKPGAQVMLLVNLDIFNGLVNGSRGVVQEILPKGHEECVTGGVKVLFLNGRTEIIKPYRQAFKYDNDKMDDPDRAYRVQTPLKLAYALTIHKSQGMSIDYLEIDLYGCFAHGQAYVALSRARTYENLRVFNFSKKNVITSDKVKDFYKNLESGKRKIAGPLAAMFDKKKVKQEIKVEIKKENSFI